MMRRCSWAIIASVILALLAVASSQRCKTIAHVHSITSRKNWEESNVTLLYGNNDDYRLVKRLGAGSFAEGYLGFNVRDNYPCVVKIYHKEKMPTRVLREILILQNLCGGPNIMKLYDVLLEKAEGKPAVVFEYANGTEFEQFMSSATDESLRFHMKELLRAINFVHKQGVIHRDLKPSNVMFDVDKRETRLIDFSLARFHYNGENHTLAGSMHYKSPEILLYNRQYGPPADMWSFGALLAAVVFQKEPFFYGHNNGDQLTAIAKVLGSAALKSYVESAKLPHNPQDPAFEEKPSVELKTFVDDKNKHLATDNALDLLAKLLLFDPGQRMTASQALSHPYFT